MTALSPEWVRAMHEYTTQRLEANRQRMAKDAQEINVFLDGEASTPPPDPLLEKIRDLLEELVLRLREENKDISNVAVLKHGLDY